MILWLRSVNRWMLRCREALIPNLSLPSLSLPEPLPPSREVISPPPPSSSILSPPLTDISLLSSTFLTEEEMSLPGGAASSLAPPTSSLAPPTSFSCQSLDLGGSVHYYSDHAPSCASSIFSTESQAQVVNPVYSSSVLPQGGVASTYDHTPSVLQVYDTVDCSFSTVPGSVNNCIPYSQQSKSRFLFSVHEY